MPTAVANLLSILDLEQLELNLFRGQSPKVGWQRVFGGQVIGQALVAASRTVDGRQPHSLHGYFMLPGDPKVPIIYEVDRIRDGRSFTTRRVVGDPARARDLLHVGVVPGHEEQASTHQATMPDVPGPETLPSEEDMQGEIIASDARAHAHLLRARATDRNAPGGDPALYVAKERWRLLFHVWIRATGTLPDDPAIHQAVLAYASDMTLLDTSLMPHGQTVFDKAIQAASLDHALWFHRPFRADEWLLYAQDTPSASGARGFSRGLIFKQDGTLVASVAQEGLVRDRG